MDNQLHMSTLQCAILANQLYINTPRRAASWLAHIISYPARLLVYMSNYSVKIYGVKKYHKRAMNE